MPQNNQSESSGSPFAVKLLPWLLGVIMLVIYLATLNHWVTLANLLPVAKVSGFTWQPEMFTPLMFLFTSPFRLLPAPLIPIALNIFSAVCAALTLVLLARSVAILPHDRTDLERAREKSDFSFLTSGSAWFPPVMAVLMFGLQFGFWQNATSFTGETLDMLFYATIIWLLLEYRLDERGGRLTLAALVYGAALTENWALVGLLPIFVIAIIWVKKLEFFNVRFLSRMVLSGLAGMLFFFLLPVVNKVSGDTGMTFWQLLKPVWQTDWQVLKAITVGQVRYNLLLMSVTTFLPVLVMSIRWSASFGDSSQMGRLLASQMFHVIHAVIFGVCVWIMFDPPFSPSQLSQGFPALTFYYLSALAIGYYSGYFLLVFGKKAVPSRRNPKPQPALPGQLKPLIPVVYWGVCAMSALMVFTLVYKNLPLIRSDNDDTLQRYADLALQSLPIKNGILLSDAEGVTSTRESRALLMEAALAKAGRAKDYLVVDTQSLSFPDYFRFLHKKFPAWPEVPDNQKLYQIRPITVLGVLSELSKSNNLCYLNPSFGYYFELFYQEPHGLNYLMKTLPNDTLMPAPLSAELIAENQKFWHETVQTEFPRLEQEIKPYDPAAHLNPPNWIIMHLHGQADPNPNAVFAANLYSRALNYWGVNLQRANDLTNAAACFANAKRANPDNVIAGFNLDFNHLLQTGGKVNFDPGRVNTDEFGKSRDWNTVMNNDGPFDEPSFLFVNTMVIARSGLPRQSVAPLNRVLQVVPDNLRVRLRLAELYLYNRRPDQALKTLDEPMNEPDRFGLNPTNSVGVNTLAAFAYLQKDQLSQGAALLNREISLHPGDTNLLTTAAQAFMARGLFTNALRVIDRRLEQTPDDPQWLFGKGFANLQMSNYVAAISAFTRVQEVSTNDPMSLFYRAYAHMQLGELDAAKTDYQTLASSYTNTTQIAYGLGEVAWRQHDTNAAIRNYESFLANAPTNVPEFKIARERLTELRGK
jgi:tetratricopeptide (TPR) repeat protein